MLVNKQLLKKFYKGDIKPHEMKIPFHLSTIIYRILSCLEAKASYNSKDLICLEDWVAEAKKFANLLPKDYVCQDAISKTLVNPFSPIMETFGQNTKDIEDVSFTDLDLYQSIIKMHYACLGKQALEHLNLLEILSNSQILSETHVKRFCNDILNWQKTPQETMDEFINEMDGNVMLALAKKRSVAEGTIYESQNSQDSQNSQNPQAWIEGTQMYALGYHGTISKFDLFIEGKEIVVIQRKNTGQTSVTNLAETLRDCIKERFGKDTNVYEAYEDNCVNGQFEYADLILGNPKECAGWVRTPTKDIPKFSEFRLN